MNSGATVSEQLRRRRKALGLSLADVARRAGTSSATLSRYEHGWTRFETGTLMKLAVALDCELSIRFLPTSAKAKAPAKAVGALGQIKRLFWDHPFSVKDLEAHPVWVVERVLEYGTLEDVQTLQQAMGKDGFLRTVAQTERLTPRTRNFWSQMLEMEGIPCTKRFSRNTAWIS